MQAQYNLRSPSVKRLMKEAQELSVPTELFYAQPLEENLFEWHFTIRGPADSEFEDGIYHGRILLPAEYPMKPPSIMLLTPNGRFEIFKKICLSISGHHPESWQPSWSIRTAMLAIIGFMPTHGHGAIGSLDYTPTERKTLARKSQDWKCPNCGSVKNALKPVTEASKHDTEEAKELATQIDFQADKEKKKNKSDKANEADGNKKEGDDDGNTDNPEPATPQNPPTGLTAADYAKFYGGTFPTMHPSMPIMPYIPPQVYKAYQEYQEKLKAGTPTTSAQQSATPTTSAQQNVDPNPTASETGSPAASSGQSGSATVPPAANEATPVTVADQTSGPRLRQRNLTHQQQAQNQQQSQINQPAELPREVAQTARSENKLVLLIMTLLSLAIVILVVRRIFFMNIWKFDSDV